MLFTSLALYGGEKVHWAFRALQFTYYGGSYVDLAITSKALDHAIEVNPIVRAYINDPVKSFSIVTGANIATHYLTGWLYKHSKPLAWVMLITLNLAKGYAIYQGIKALK